MIYTLVKPAVVRGLMQALSNAAGSGCISASVSRRLSFNWPLEATCLASTLITAADTSPQAQRTFAGLLGKRQQLLACSAPRVSIQFDKGKECEYLHRSASILDHFALKYSWEKVEWKDTSAIEEISRFIFILSFFVLARFTPLEWSSYFQKDKYLPFFFIL